MVLPWLALQRSFSFAQIMVLISGEGHITGSSVLVHLQFSSHLMFISPQFFHVDFKVWYSYVLGTGSVLPVSESAHMPLPSSYCI